MASDIDWPNIPPGLVLPKALRSGYGYAPRDACVSATFGPTTLSRRVFSDVPVDFDQIGWLFTREQWGYFEDFFWHRLDAGTRYFNLPLLVAGRELAPVEVSFQGRMPRYGVVGVSHCNTVGQVTTRAGTQRSAIEFSGLFSFDELLIG